MKIKQLLCLLLAACLLFCGCSVRPVDDGEDEDVQITLTDSACSLQMGDTFQIRFTTSVENAPVTFSSSDSSVATVDANGLIRAEGKGSAVVSVSAGEYSKAYVEVTVAPEMLKALPTILLGNQQLELITGTSYTMIASILLGTQTLENVTLNWETSDSNVLTVENGRVTAQQPGEVELKVSAEVNGVKAERTCTVTVYPYYRIELDRQTVKTAVGSVFRMSARVFDADGNEVQVEPGELEPVSSDESSIRVVGDAFQTINLGTPSVGFRYKGNVASIPTEIFGVGATFFKGSVSDYYGTVAGKTFSGILFQSGAYQPHMYFSEYGIEQIKAYAEANGYTTLRVHAYAIVTNNALVLNMTKWFNDSWDYYDLSMSDITTACDFWSQSEGSTECYLWFEFL